MTAAERASALLKGREIDCPACGAFPMRREPDFDLGSFFGGRQSGRMICETCGLEASRSMCAAAGQPGDETAALHLLAEEGRQ